MSSKKNRKKKSQQGTAAEVVMSGVNVAAAEQMNTEPPIDTVQEAVMEEPQQAAEVYNEERQTVTEVPVVESAYGYGAEEHWELEPSIYRDDDEEPEEDPSYDRANVNRLKKLILVGLIVMFLIPTVLCLILLMKINSMQNEMEELREEALSKKQQERMLAEENSTEDPLAQEQNAYASVERGKNANAHVLTQQQPINPEDFPDDVIFPKSSTEEPVTEEVTETEVTNGRKVYLTFDDGPSENTGRLLNILKKKGVKATFFLVLNDTENTPVIQRIANEGHAMGIHSASHVYGEIYATLDSFTADVERVHDLLYEMTGQDVKLYRFPGGSSNRVSEVDIQDCIQWLTDEGYTYYDWNALSEDAEAEYTDPYVLNANVMRYIHGNSGDSVVLMHDLDGHPETLEALPVLIDTLLNEGYEICAIDGDTEPVQHRKLVTEEASEEDPEGTADVTAPEYEE